MARKFRISIQLVSKLVVEARRQPEKLRDMKAKEKKQREAIEDSLRPLDELDAERIATWKTVGDLKPKVRVRPQNSAVDVMFEGRAPTLAEYMEQADWSDEEEDER